MWKIKRVKNLFARILVILGGLASIIGLLWIIWLPVFGDFTNFPLPLAISWTGCIIAAVGLLLQDP